MSVRDGRVSLDSDDSGEGTVVDIRLPVTMVAADPDVRQVAS